MKFIIEAACACNTGRIRSNNEDNLYFDGKCLEMEHNGLKHPVCIEQALKNGLCLAVFDGMGGENFGENASYAAAQEMQLTERTFADFFIPERKYLNRMVTRVNGAVVAEAKKLQTERMGSTMVTLYFSGRYVYVCNIGDSRAYRLREGEFLQISEDHVDSLLGREGKKAPLTQHLGIDPEDMLLEPHIAKSELKRGDQYLLCSDGLTDMLTNFEICDIMLSSTDAEACVNALVEEAIERGGRDNITAIVCRIQ